LILNGAPQDISSARPKACLKELRNLRRALEDSDSSLPKLSTYPLRLVSVNNFPTAAGLASSAAGFAALVRAIADLYKLPQTATELSLIARQGSGSACRSLMGGYVAWDMGSKSDGTDSVARVVASKEHWPEMNALILVVSADKKGVSSTSGMQATAKTSELFQHRASTVVPNAMRAMEKAIQAKDFESFAKITMRESNSFHACCLDTEPPIFYLNDISRAAIRAVEMINEKSGKVVAAYTFDAGPNAVIYYLDENSKVVAGALKSVLSSQEGWESAKGRAVEVSAQQNTIDNKVAQILSAGVSRVIVTGIGDDPVSVGEHLVDTAGNLSST
jgi:diphosphomevalonate decarboxylase